MATEQSPGSRPDSRQATLAPPADPGITPPLEGFDEKVSPPPALKRRDGDAPMMQEGGHPRIPSPVDQRIQLPPPGGQSAATHVSPRKQGSQSGETDDDDDDEDTTTASSADSYDVEIDFQETPWQSTFEAVWLPCANATLANVCFLQLPLIVVRGGVYAGLIALGASYLAAALTWVSIGALVTSLHSHHDADGPYQLLSRQLGSEFGGSVGLLYWLVFVVLCAVHAHGAADVLFWAIRDAGAGDWLEPFAATSVLAAAAVCLVCGITFYGVTHVSLVEAAGVVFSVLAIISVIAGACSDTTSPWKPGGWSGAVFRENWRHDGMSPTEAFVRCFPACLGVLAVLGRPTDLEHPNKRLPWATIKSLSLCWLAFAIFAVVLAGAVAPARAGAAGPELVTDESGVGVIARAAWPSRGAGEVLIIAAVFLQCMQALILAPGVLLSIAQDHVVPLFTPFQSVVDGEPRNARLLSTFLAVALVPLRSLLCHTATVVMLLCFIVINSATAINSFVESPHWQPQGCVFRTRSFSVMGSVLGLFAVFAIQWQMALTCLLLILALAKYLEFRTDFSSWGDGIRGLQLQQALEKLLSLEGGASQSAGGALQSKNWRPQLLVLVRLTEDGLPAHPRLLSVADQLKMGKGLNIVGAVITGKVLEKVAEVEEGRKRLISKLEELSIRGFCSVLAAPAYLDGATYFLQGAGLGLLSPNSLLLAWPSHWRKSEFKKDKDGVVSKHHYKEVKMTAASEFSQLLVMAFETSKAVMVVKGIDYFPCETDELHEMEGDIRFAVGDHIDLWWIVHDGAIELMIAFLLRQHAVWKKARLRIFSICDEDDDTDTIAEKLSEELARLKIDVELRIQPVATSWIEEFHRTGEEEVERRHKAMDRLAMTQQEREHDVDEIFDHAHKRKPRGGTGSRQPSPRSLFTQSLGPTSQGTTPRDPAGTERGPGNHIPTVTSDVVRSREQFPDAAHPVRTCSGEMSERPVGVAAELTADVPASAIDFAPIAQVGKGRSASNQSMHSDHGGGLHIDGFERVELQGAAHSKPAHRNQTKHSMHFECLNQLIREHSEARDLVLISLPDPLIWQDDINQFPEEAREKKRVQYSLEFMDDMERMMHGLERVILIRGSGEEIITHFW